MTKKTHPVRSALPRHLADAIRHAWPDGIVDMPASLDEAPFWNLYPKLKARWSGIKRSGMLYERNPQGGSQWGEVSDPEESQDWDEGSRSYYQFFISLLDDRFQFDTDIIEPDEDGIERRFQGEGRIGCVAGISMVAPFAVVTLDQIDVFENGSRSEPSLEPHIFGLDGRKVDLEEHYREMVDDEGLMLLRQPRSQVVCILNDFGIAVIPEKDLCRFRRSLSFEYEPLYNALLKYILRGPVVHIDETTVHLQDQKGYVWVLASLDSAFFLYRPNREGAFLSQMLSPFRGVLVSDFYGAYDSLSCLQQKCLVHFVRDIDDDVLKNPFDEELKTIAQEFSAMLQPIIQSVDRFGLRKRHLRKHKKSVNRFLSSLQSRDLISPVARGYKQRLEKTGAKMFTFLDYDGVPWNNNYAEHAIKRFAKYRRLFDGFYTEESLHEYLILASVLTTCEFNNINRLKFLLSEEKSLEGLLTMGRGKSRKSAAIRSDNSRLAMERITCLTADSKPVPPEWSAVQQ